MKEVVTVEHAALEPYTPDGYTAALQSAIEQLSPSLVLLPHTYQTRDFAPKLAAQDEPGHPHRRDRDQAGRRRDGLRAPDVPGQADGRRRAAGRCAALRHVPDWGVPRRSGGSRRVAGADPRPRRLARTPAEIRQQPEPPFQEAKQAVDLSQAARIVSVGRGIKEQANIPIAQQLAEALGAEIAASRPICDAGWLPMERQVGSSGQTVAPKLYLALGISGAIQHLVGMKGASTIVAINKDPDAPIFEVADYGIVGDLFEIVPALTNALKE